MVLRNFNSSHGVDSSCCGRSYLGCSRIEMWLLLSTLREYMIKCSTFEIDRSFKIRIFNIIILSALKESDMTIYISTRIF